MSRRRNVVVRSALLIFVVFGLFNMFQPVRAAAPSWSSPILADTHRGLDILPSALQASNGTMWLAWQSNRNGLFTGRPDIIYKTYTNGVWSSDHNLTNSGWNSGPALVQLSNGTILAFWASKSGTSYIVVSSLTNGASWSPPVQVTSTTLNDTQASAAVGRDGTVWLVWTRVNSTCSSCPAIKQLYYKTWKGGVWSAEVKLTYDSNQNYGSGVVVGKDGIVRVTWSKGAPGSIYQLYYKTYNGSGWTSDTPIVSSSSTDEHPSMMQDRNGTLWLFWGRLVVVSLLIQYYELVGKYSYDLGNTWSQEIVLTNTPNTIDSQMPSAIQSNTGVKPLWVFYSSDLNVPDLDIYALQSSGIYPVHDVTVAGIYSSNNLGTSWEYPGGLKSVGESAIVTVRVAIANIGDYVENVNATLSTSNTTITRIGSLKSLVGPGNTMNFYFYWNTTNARPGRYQMSVSIAALPSESLGNMGDNSYSIPNQVHIIPFGDIDQDGSVTVVDLSIFLYDFGFSSTCGCSRYNPYADIHGTGTIDIIDVGIVLANYNIYA
jgi:hypothetical protein